MNDQELIIYARDAASRGDDLFASDIRRAFRRKALTAHPDKAGDAYDPALYERLERARDVLLHAGAREAYDAGMRAVLQKKMQLEQMGQKRRQLVEDLERREAEAKRAKMEQPEVRGVTPVVPVKVETEKPVPPTINRPDVAATPADGQPTPPSTTYDPDYEAQIAELERRIKEKQLRKAEKKAKRAGTPTAPEAQGKETNNAPPPPVAEPQADEVKISTPAEPTPPPAAGNPSKASDKFASTMARLRAAQAAKEEARRKKAEEEARATATSAV
ncbi:hypothetical protein N0V88_005860 [Collariella sp. IMI 366227]|nr:hypothetical protein N0V88_005860 [Collariella sp. IMI 366227]